MWVSFLRPRQITTQLIAFCLVLFFTFAVSRIGAATGLDADKPTMSLHEAVIKTIQHNPEILSFGYRLKAQQGRVQQAGLAPSPEFSIELEDFLGNGDKKALDSAQTTFSISWVLDRGVRQHQLNAASAGLSLIAAESDIRQLDAAAETARRYLVSLAYQARKRNSDKVIQLAEKTIKAVRKRVTAGKTPKADLSRAIAELARRKLQRKEIEFELKSANHRLAAQWGEISPAFVKVEGDITYIPRVATFESLKSQLSQNPEFARLLSDQRLKQTQLQLALAQKEPDWRINAGVRHTNINNDQSFVAGITIPFGERVRNSGRIAEARANLAKTDAEEYAARIRLETTLYVMYEKLQYSLHAIETVRDDIIPPLERALTETRRAYNIGRYRYLEWRIVQAEMLDAYNSLIEVSTDAHRYIIEIERLTGVRLTQETKTGRQL